MTTTPAAAPSTASISPSESRLPWGCWGRTAKPGPPRGGFVKALGQGEFGGSRQTSSSFASRWPVATAYIG